MAEKSIGVSLLGCGVVGGGVVKILTEQADLIRQRTGLRFDVRQVVVRDPAKPRPGNVRVTTDLDAAIDDPGTDIILELMGGTEAAATAVRRALRAGKPVVTANKSLLATQGAELFALAHQHDTCIAFEASCGGGIPIVQSLTGGLIANRIDALVGIVNGTCNFILTKMTHNGWSYADALKEAQAAGFAEADPTMDVSGRDAAQKLAILGGLAFNARIGEQDLHVEGIDRLQAADIQFAAEIGYVIKLLAIAERSGEGLFLRVHPTLVHKSDVLADVSGSFNAISVYGHALGHALFYGRGAGQMPTADAVVADLVGVGLGTVPLAFKQLRIFPDGAGPVRVHPFDQLQSRYYLRLMVRDEPGVLAQVTRILGDHRISLSAILQHELTDGQQVPVVITTHQANEGAMQRAIAAIDQLQTVSGPSVCLRIIDQPKEFASN